MYNGRYLILPCFRALLDGGRVCKSSNGGGGDVDSGGGGGGERGVEAPVGKGLDAEEERRVGETGSDEASILRTGKPLAWRCWN